MNHQISYLLQDIFNLLPNIESPRFVEALTTKTNDQSLVLYLGSLVRATLALHALINNKLEKRAAEAKEEAPKEADGGTPADAKPAEEGEKKAEK